MDGIKRVKEVFCILAVEIASFSVVKNAWKERQRREHLRLMVIIQRCVGGGDKLCDDIVHIDTAVGYSPGEIGGHYEKFKKHKCQRRKTQPRRDGTPAQQVEQQYRRHAVFPVVGVHQKCRHVTNGAKRQSQQQARLFVLGERGLAEPCVNCLGQVGNGIDRRKS